MNTTEEFQTLFTAIKNRVDSLFVKFEDDPDLIREPLVKSKLEQLLILMAKVEQLLE